MTENPLRRPYHFALCQNASSLLGSLNRATPAPGGRASGSVSAHCEIHVHMSISHCVFTYNVSQMVYYTIILEWSFYIHAHIVVILVITYGSIPHLHAAMLVTSEFKQYR